MPPVDPKARTAEPDGSVPPSPIEEPVDAVPARRRARIAAERSEERDTTLWSLTNR